LRVGEAMRLYTAQEAADVLRIKKQTVWKYGREGKLKTVRFGRTVRFDLEGGTSNGNQSKGIFQGLCEGR
jgi:excisionase family DNA binding protein